MIGGVNQECRPQQSDRSKLTGSTIHQRASKALPTMLGGDSQMVKVTAPAIVTTEHRTDESSLQQRGRADAWIAFQKGNQHLGRLLYREADAICVLPEIKSCGYVGGNHGSNCQELFKSCKILGARRISLIGRGFHASRQTS